MDEKRLAEKKEEIFKLLDKLAQYRELSESEVKRIQDQARAILGRQVLN